MLSLQLRNRHISDSDSLALKPKSDFRNLEFYAQMPLLSINVKVFGHVPVQFIDSPAPTAQAPLCDSFKIRRKQQPHVISDYCAKSSKVHEYFSCII